MHELGHTRSVHRADHLLQTPDTFVRAPLPGMRGATAIIHVAPVRGAAFTQYTAEFEKGGQLAPVAWQRFVYVLGGKLDIYGHSFSADDYAYVPAGSGAVISATCAARAVLIEKPYQPLTGVEVPDFLAGQESLVAPQSFMGDDCLQVRPLLPDNPAFDFAVNTMTYQPGTALPMVEIHVMEHGLLMLSGGGIYRLGDHWYPVTMGDFIWMAPYCPQWFGALGRTPAKYLIYKDRNRFPQNERR